MLYVYFCSSCNSIGRRLNRRSTTVSSAIVEISPRSRSPTAILRRTRLMILPERVFGRPGASCRKSGCENGPIFFLTVINVLKITFQLLFHNILWHTKHTVLLFRTLIWRIDDVACQLILFSWMEKKSFVGSRCKKETNSSEKICLIIIRDQSKCTIFICIVTLKQKLVMIDNNGKETIIFNWWTEILIINSKLTNGF